MKPVLALFTGLAAGFLLAGCAFDGAPAPQTVISEPQPQAPAVSEPVSDMPSMGAVQDIGTAPFQRPITGSCGMENFQHHVGQPRIEVDSRSLPANYRVVGRYSRVTMEYLPERLTIRIADDDTVESITCG
ncbi:I78 family peptidase inhibitor [Maricaulis salignorans]|uniref:I78 family peptidase inhibitor n=1 Tax=Maricaulis salignorans TaxID=144026 RepID=UPI003A9048F1